MREKPIKMPDNIESYLAIEGNPPPTLRDQFAMAALTGILGRGGGDERYTYHRVSEVAYTYADAMLEERGK